MITGLSNEWQEAVKSKSTSLPIAFVEIDGIEYKGSGNGVLDRIDSSLVADSFIGGFNMQVYSIQLYCVDKIEEMNSLFKKKANIHFGYDTTEFIVKKNMTVDSIEFNDNQTSCMITLVDSAFKFDEAVKEISTPAKGKDIIEHFCLKCGVSRSGNKNLLFDNFVFNRLNIDTDGSISYRQLISEYAQINGVMAVIDFNGSLKFVDVIHGDNTGYKIEPSNYTTIKIQKKVGEINSLKLARTDQTGDEDYDYIVFNDDDSIETNGMTQVRMSANAWVDLILEEVGQRIFDNIKGFYYYPFTVEDWKPNFALEQGDVLTVVDVQGNEFKSVLMNESMRYGGGCVANLETKELPSTLPVYELQSIFNDIKTTRIIVDKVKQEVKIVVDDQNELNQKITKIEQDTESVKVQVTEINSNNIVENLNGEEGVIKWTFSQNGLLPSTTLLPSKNLYPKSTNSPIFKVLDSPKSISETEIYFFAKGTALSDLARVVEGGRIYSYKVRRMQGNKLFKVRIHEYSSEDTRIKITTIIDTKEVKTYESATMTLQNDTKFIRFEYVIDNPNFSLSEGMFNRGVPKEYFKSGKEAYNYANAEIKVLSTEIDLRVEKDGVIAAINLSSETAKIKANNIELEGSVTVNEKFKVLTDGTIQAVDGKFSGTITATNIDGGEIKGAKIIATKGSVGGWSMSNNSLHQRMTKVYDFTLDDAEKIKRYIMGTGTLTEAEKEKYDMTQDGQINSSDYVIVKEIAESSDKSVSADAVFNTDDYNSVIVVKAVSGSAFAGAETKIGIHGLKTNGSVTSKQIYSDYTNSKEVVVTSKLTFMQNTKVNLNGFDYTLRRESDGTLKLV